MSIKSIPATTAVEATTPLSQGEKSAKSGATALERLAHQKGKTPEQEMARLRKAAKEFEAFFQYQMLKTMRQTTLGEDKKDGMFGDGLGKGMFTDMFDMELSRSMPTNSPRSLASILTKSLEKRVQSEFTDPNDQKTALHELHKLSGVAGISLQHERKAIPTTHPAIQLPSTKTQNSVPIRVPHERTKPVANPHAVSLNGVKQSAKPDTHPLSDIRERYGDLIDQAAARHGVDSALIEAVIAAESSGNPNAVSPAGAQGLMQLMPDTARDMSVADPLSAKQSIDGGTKYLARMLNRFGSLPVALAAYNAGPGRVTKSGGIPPIAETKNYVANVMSHYETVRMANAGGSMAPTPKAKPATDR